MIKIEKPLKELYISLNNVAYIHYQPRVNGIVINPYNNLRTYNVSEFILDTGAGITILNANFSSLFKDTQPHSSTRILYGSGEKLLPIYQIQLKMYDYVFNLKAAHDREMQLTSLLGHYDFLNTFNYFGINKNRRIFTLFKQ